MSWTHLRDEVIKSRKIHRCICCGQNILVKEVYIQRTNADNTSREISIMRMHKECEEESSKWSNDDWEVFSAYEMERTKKKGL